MTVIHDQVYGLQIFLLILWVTLDSTFNFVKSNICFLFAPVAGVISKKSLPSQGSAAFVLCLLLRELVCEVLCLGPWFILI